ncbi:MAG: ornithine carbamoyltransferase [Spirochaetae bacterium HGW-Spirochaetae-9]|nr:MAG: ornithine carbamoyltransferase [Spirochaetae bacterium HGW-Spirochaetae-9]
MNPKSLRGRSLLTWINFTPREIRGFLELTKKAKADSRKFAVHQRFKGKSLALVLEKPSLRTRTAFETAFGEEGGHSVCISMHAPEREGNEPLEDVARSLGRMFSAIAVLGSRQENVEAFAKYSGLPVYNGLTNLFHPTQVLADYFTLEEEFGSLTGRKLVYVGDGRNTIARSLMVICSKMGADLTIAAPRALWPDPDLKDMCRTFASESGSVFEVTDNQEEGVRGASAIYAGTSAFPSEASLEKQDNELLIPYLVDAGLMTATGNPRCIFLHCLPALKGRAVAFDVFEGKHSRVFEQVENQKHAIKAIMLATL